MDIHASSLLESTPDKPPNPSEFDLFVPWACNQLAISRTVFVNKVLQAEYVSSTTPLERTKKRKMSRISKVEENAADLVDQCKFLPSFAINPGDEIQILAIYDTSDNLVQLKFENKRTIPRLVFRVINLIIKYYPYLSAITIARGLDSASLYDICKFLPYSHITDICLDNTFVPEGNYYVLLEKASCLRSLSLCRCSITDDVIETIAAQLPFPLPASKSLCILNLSTNVITDIGAKYLADALRSNRQLYYLNLADNKLPDDGAKHLLHVLQSFPLTFAELLASKARHMEYFKQKSKLVQRFLIELRTTELERPASKRKIGKPVQKKKGFEKEGSLKSLQSKSTSIMNTILYEKASVMAERNLGNFRDPFDGENTDMIGCISYCQGNNTLCYLNLAYNHLTYETAKTLLSVLKYQKLKGKRPKGLINVLIEGNPLPIECKELNIIDDIIRTNLPTNQALSLAKKRGSNKASSVTH